MTRYTSVKISVLMNVDENHLFSKKIFQTNKEGRFLTNCIQPENCIPIAMTIKKNDY